MSSTSSAPIADSIASTRSGEAVTPAARSVRANPSTVATTSRGGADGAQEALPTSGAPWTGVEPPVPGRGPGSAATEQRSAGERVHPVGVLAVLEHRAERAGGEVGVEVARAEGVQRRGPVHRLGHA